MPAFGAGLKPWLKQKVEYQNVGGNVGHGFKFQYDLEEDDDGEKWTQWAGDGGAINGATLLYNKLTFSWGDVAGAGQSNGYNLGINACYLYSDMDKYRELGSPGEYRVEKIEFDDGDTLVRKTTELVPNHHILIGKPYDPDGTGFPNPEETLFIDKAQASLNDFKEFYPLNIYYINPDSYSISSQTVNFDQKAWLHKSWSHKAQNDKPSDDHYVNDVNWGVEIGFDWDGAYKIIGEKGEEDWQYNRRLTYPTQSFPSLSIWDDDFQFIGADPADTEDGSPQDGFPVPPVDGPTDPPDENFTLEDI